MKKNELQFFTIIFASILISVAIAYYFVSWVMENPEMALQVILTMLMSVLIFAVILKILQEA